MEHIKSLNNLFRGTCVFGEGDLLSLLSELTGSQLPHFLVIFITIVHQERERDGTWRKGLMM